MTDQIRTALAAMLCSIMISSAGAQDTTQDLPTQKTTNQQVGDWVVTCRSDDKANKSCVMSQRLSNAQTKQVVLAWLIGKNAAGDQVMTLRTPLGLLLNKGIILQVDANPHLVMSFRTCVKTFCEAVQPLNPALIGHLTRGAAAKVQMKNLQDQAFDIDVSLKGFSKAFKILQAELKSN